MRALCLVGLLAVVGCGGGASFVKSPETTLGRVVVYRNGVAYFERSARVTGDTLNLSVPGDKIDDFLKSLTVVDARTGEPAPIAYPNKPSTSKTGLVDMSIKVGGGARDLRLTYVTESPSWKPSYRVVLDDDKTVRLQGWAIVDNTSGEDWKHVKLGVGSSSALSFRFDLHSVRLVERETLRDTELFAQAPPTGQVTHATANVRARVLAEVSDGLLAEEQAKEKDDAERMAMKKAVPVSSPRGGGGRATSARPPRMAADRIPADPKPTELSRVAHAARASKNQIVIEGYADTSDGDKFAASLDRANRVRDQLVRSGVDPSQVIAVGNGVQSGRTGGVRIVEAPPQAQAHATTPGAAATEASLGTDPIGTSHFESKTAMTVPRGTSAMISILEAKTPGEVVYLYDPDSPRGNPAFPYRALRLENPTESALESGPVTVYARGRFVGEGLSEPIPARATAFVPFALDRQVVVERKRSERDAIARVLTVQRGVFSTEMQQTRRTEVTLTNRRTEKAVVYVRHPVEKGYRVVKQPGKPDQLGGANVYRVELGAGEQAVAVIEETTPIFRSVDIRSPSGLDLVRVFVSSGAAEGPLREAVDDLVRLQQEIGTLEQRIETTREQLTELRERAGELHVQIVTLRAVRTTAGPLLRDLEKKLTEMNDRTSRATIDLVGHQEKHMVARIRFQDRVAELSLAAAGERKPGGA